MTDSKTAEEQYEDARVLAIQRHAAMLARYHEYLGAEQLYQVMMGAGLAMTATMVPRAAVRQAAATKIGVMRNAYQQAEQAAEEADTAYDQAWAARGEARKAAAL